MPQQDIFACATADDSHCAFLCNLQAQCLLLPKVLRFGNLVYWAPTGGNKSMVAEVLKLCKIASSGKAALLALLFVYLFEEKVHCRISV